MKKLVLCIALFSSTLPLLAQKFGAFEIIDKGAIEFQSNCMQAEFGGDYQQQALKNFKVEKDKNTYKVSGDFIVKARKGSGSIDFGGTVSTGGAVRKSKASCKFVKTIKKIKNGVEVESSFQTPERNVGKDRMSYSIYLPTMLYKDRIWIDDIQIKEFPAKKKLFKAKKVKIVMQWRTLELDGDFECEVFTTKWSPSRSGMELVGVRIFYNKVSDTLYSLNLKISDFTILHKIMDISTIANAEIDLPIPEITSHFVGVRYKILPKRKGIVIPAGKSVEVDFKKSWSAYLVILNAFDKLTDDDKIVGKVIVNYVNNKQQVFEVGKSFTGELNSDKHPENATRAWTSQWKGKPVSLYTTEVKTGNALIKSVKFENNSSGNWTIAAVSCNREKVGAIRCDESYITANDLYQPIYYKRPVAKGSALDMSGILDAPAGKYGRIKVKDGKFVFEKTGKQIRFYGANTCGSANIPSKEEAIAMADQFARMGLNIWRIHHYDDIVTTSKNGDSAELNPEAMDKLDFLFAEMKKRGIYITTDFYTKRKLLPHEYDDIKYRGQNMKLVFAASDKAVKNLQRFITNILTHVNPYTGLAYKDDPAFFSVVVRNESSYLGTRNFVVRTPVDSEAMRPKFERWLNANKDKYPTLKSEHVRYQLFLLDAYDETHGKLIKTIKDIAPDLLVSDQNHWHGFLKKAMSTTYDFSSQNSYFGHPLFPEYKFKSPVQIRNDSPISNLGGSTVKAVDSQIFDKPLIITEWCYVPPNLHYAQGPFLVGAYSSLNELGGLCYFAFSHSSRAIFKNKNVTTFDFASDPIMSMAHRAAVMMYTRGDIQPSPVSFPAVVLTNYYRNGSIKFSNYRVPGYAELGLIGRVGHVVADKVENVKLPEDATAVLFSEPAWEKMDTKGALPLVYDKTNTFFSQIKKTNIGKGKIDEQNNFYRSSTGELELDAKNENWKAVSPRTESFLLREGQSLQGKFASVKSEKSLASVLVSSLDKADLKDSKRILILHLTDVKNTYQKFGDKDMTVVQSFGNPPKSETPLLIRNGKICLTLNSTLEGFKLYALQTDGKRLFEVPITCENNKAKLNLSVHNSQGAVLAYELVKE